LDLFRFVDETIDKNNESIFYRITIERLNKNSYSRSFCLYRSDKEIKEDDIKGLKREIISYLNAIVKLGVANRKLKTTQEKKD